MMSPEPEDELGLAMQQFGLLDAPGRLKMLGEYLRFNASWFNWVQECEDQFLISKPFKDEGRIV